MHHEVMSEQGPGPESLEIPKSPSPVHHQHRHREPTSFNFTVRKQADKKLFHSFPQHHHNYGLENIFPKKPQEHRPETK
jgi:hypothetical protein